MLNKNIFSQNINEDLKEIKKIIKSNLTDKENKINRLFESLGADNGKLLRAAFVLIGGGFGNIERERLVNICAAVELLHLATLVHDDIIDESSLRRGEKTIQSSFGVKSALFTGDYLFSQSYVLFSKNTSPKSIIAVSETIKTICTGEISQFFSTHSFNCTIKSYLKRINGKCASLFSLSLSIGACEGNAPIVIAKKLKSIGYYTGMAFQLIDDILDITTPTEVLGKPAGNDITQGIYTLPVLYELRNGNEVLFRFIKDGNMSDAVSILRKSDGLIKAKKIAERYSYKALKLIGELPNSNETEALRMLVEKMLIREY